MEINFISVLAVYNFEASQWSNIEKALNRLTGKNPICLKNLNVDFIYFLFQSLIYKIAEITDIFQTFSTSSSELAQRERGIQELELDVNNSTQRISLASNALADLRLQASELKNSAGDLKEKATELQEENVEGNIDIFSCLSN